MSNDDAVLKRLPCDKCGEFHMEEITDDEYKRWHAGEFQIYCDDCQYGMLHNVSHEVELRRAFGKLVNADSTKPNWPKLGCFFLLVVCPWGTGALVIAYTLAKFFVGEVK